MYFVLGGERVMERAAEMYQQWADAFASIGYSHISTDTAAKILAVLSVYGGHNEYFTHSTMLITDVKAAQRMFNLNGGEVREFFDDICDVLVAFDGDGDVGFRSADEVD